jgi:molybdate/tungstate transport system permease protein
MAFMTKLKSIKTAQLLALLLSGIVLWFLIAPIVGMFSSVSFGDLWATSNDVVVRESIFITIVIAFFTTFFFALMSIPLAYILARFEFRGKPILIGLINIPIVIPHSAAGIAVLGLISRESALGKIADSMGLSLVGSTFSIGLAMAFVSVPFLINTAREGFLSVPVRMEQTARLLGANHTRVFFTISLPLAWRHVLTGIIQMFARGMSEFGAVVMVAYHPMITPVLIYERFAAYGLKYAQPVAVLFILICLVVFVILRKLASGTYVKNGEPV